MGFPNRSAVKNPPAMQKTQEMQVLSLSQEDPLEKGVAIHSSILAWEFHGQRILAGYNQRVWKESDMTERVSTAQVILMIFINIKHMV